MVFAPRCDNFKCPFIIEEALNDFHVLSGATCPNDTNTVQSPVLPPPPASSTRLNEQLNELLFRDIFLGVLSRTTSRGKHAYLPWAGKTISSVS
jgi:ssDNA-specific exonuclease RecJ